MTDSKTTKAALEAASEALAGAAQAFEALAMLQGARKPPTNGKEKKTGLLTVSEAADALGMSTAWVYQQTDSGELPHVRLGGAVRLRRKDVDKFVSERVLGGS